MSALRQLRTTDQEIVLQPWLYTIAKNACIDEFRRGERGTAVPVGSDDDLTVGPGLDALAGADARRRDRVKAAPRRPARRLRRAVGHAPPTAGDAGIRRAVVRRDRSSARDEPADGRERSVPRSPQARLRVRRAGDRPPLRADRRRDRGRHVRDRQGPRAQRAATGDPSSLPLSELPSPRDDGPRRRGAAEAAQRCRQARRAAAVRVLAQALAARSRRHRLRRGRRRRPQPRSAGRRRPPARRPRARRSAWEPPRSRRPWWRSPAPAAGWR